MKIKVPAIPQMLIWTYHVEENQTESIQMKRTESSFGYAKRILRAATEMCSATLTGNCVSFLKKPGSFIEPKNVQKPEMRIVPIKYKILKMPRSETSFN